MRRQLGLVKLHVAIGTCNDHNAVLRVIVHHDQRHTCRHKWVLQNATVVAAIFFQSCDQDGPIGVCADLPEHAYRSAQTGAADRLVATFTAGQIMNGVPLKCFTVQRLSLIHI